MQSIVWFAVPTAEFAAGNRRIGHLLAFAHRTPAAARMKGEQDQLPIEGLESDHRSRRQVAKRRTELDDLRSQDGATDQRGFATLCKGRRKRREFLLEQVPPSLPSQKDRHQAVSGDMHLKHWIIGPYKGAVIEQP